MAGVLAAIDHSNLQVVWDPASAYISGEKPFPSGYQMLDATRIALVHAKDCTLEGHKPVWEPLGDGDIDWQGQIDALAEDGYERIHQPRNLLDRHPGLRAKPEAHGRISGVVR